MESVDTRRLARFLAKCLGVLEWLDGFKDVVTIVAAVVLFVRAVIATDGIGSVVTLDAFLALLIIVVRISSLFVQRLQEQRSDPLRPFARTLQSPWTLWLKALDGPPRDLVGQPVNSEAMLKTAVTLGIEGLGETVNYITADDRTRAYRLWSDAMPGAVQVIRERATSEDVGLFVVLGLNAEGERHYLKENRRPFLFDAGDLAPAPEDVRVIVAQTVYLREGHTSSPRIHDAVRILYQQTETMTRGWSTRPRPRIVMEAVSGTGAQFASMLGLVPIATVERPNNRVHTIYELPPGRREGFRLLRLLKMILRLVARGR